MRLSLWKKETYDVNFSSKIKFKKKTKTCFFYV